MDDALPRDARALIIYNPAAGQAASLAQELEAARAVWAAHGWSVELRPTGGPGDGTRLARAAATEGYDVVAAAGGDGTINEVINGLAGSQTVLAPLPVGTVNVWVREIGLPLSPRAAAEALLAGQVRRIDLGLAGGRYFLLMAGVGFDAAVVGEVRSEEKRRLGVLAYALRTADLATRFRGKPTRITIDGRRVRGRVLLVVIGNSQLYGGIFRITARACINDGLLDVCVIKGANLAEAPLRVFSILRQRYTPDPRIEYHRARSVRVEARSPLPVQVDGDHAGETPMIFTAVPGALRALMPHSVPADDLLRDAPAPRRRFWQRALGWVGRAPLAGQPVRR